MGLALFVGGYTATAFDSVGRLFIANQSMGGIVVMNPGGGSQLYAGGLNSPFGLAFDASGVLHVAHFDTRRIRGLVSQILPGGKVKAVVSDLDSPAGIAFDAQGALFISENRKGSVLKVESNGNRIVFASGLSGPQGLAFSGNGRLLVAENGSGKVTEIAMTGERVTRASGLQGPMYLAVTDDAPVSLAIAGQGASAPSATLVLEGAPLSYREIYHSLDLILWRSMGRYQLIGGKLLTLTVPLEVDVERGFFASERR
jgi:sugar lactone lactonase YvrE